MITRRGGGAASQLWLGAAAAVLFFALLALLPTQAAAQDPQQALVRLVNMTTEPCNVTAGFTAGQCVRLRIAVGPRQGVLSVEQTLSNADLLAGQNATGAEQCLSLGNDASVTVRLTGAVVGWTMVQDEDRINIPDSYAKSYSDRNNATSDVACFVGQAANESNLLNPGLCSVTPDAVCRDSVDAALPSRYLGYSCMAAAPATPGSAPMPRTNCSGGRVLLEALPDRYGGLGFAPPNNGAPFTPSGWPPLPCPSPHGSQNPKNRTECARMRCPACPSAGLGNYSFASDDARIASWTRWRVYLVVLDVRAVYPVNVSLNVGSAVGTQLSGENVFWNPNQQSSTIVSGLPLSSLYTLDPSVPPSVPPAMLPPITTGTFVVTQASPVFNSAIEIPTENTFTNPRATGDPPPQTWFTGLNFNGMDSQELRIGPDCGYYGVTMPHFDEDAAEFINYCSVAAAAQGGVDDPTSDRCFPKPRAFPLTVPPNVVGASLSLYVRENVDQFIATNGTAPTLPNLPTIYTPDVPNLWLSIIPTLSDTGTYQGMLLNFQPPGVDSTGTRPIATTVFDYVFSASGLTGGSVQNVTATHYISGAMCSPVLGVESPLTATVCDQSPDTGGAPTAVAVQLACPAPFGQGYTVLTPLRSAAVPAGGCVGLDFTISVGGPLPRQDRGCVLTLANPCGRPISVFNVSCSEQPFVPTPPPTSPPPFPTPAPTPVPPSTTAASAQSTTASTAVIVVASVGIGLALLCCLLMLLFAYRQYRRGKKGKRSSLGAAGRLPAEGAFGARIAAVQSPPARPSAAQQYEQPSLLRQRR